MVWLVGTNLARRPTRANTERRVEESSKSQTTQRRTCSRLSWSNLKLRFGWRCGRPALVDTAQPARSIPGTTKSRTAVFNPRQDVNCTDYGQEDEKTLTNWVKTLVSMDKSWLCSGNTGVDPHEANGWTRRSHWSYTPSSCDNFKPPITTGDKSVPQKISQIKDNGRIMKFISQQYRNFRAFNST
jgi:hypothetical protein